MLGDKMIKHTITVSFLLSIFVLLAEFNLYSQQLQNNQNELEWYKVDGVSIPIPPQEHPRLYLRSKDIPDLKLRMSDPILEEVWQELIKLGKKELPKVDDADKKWRYYVLHYGTKVNVELDALRYLISGKKNLGRKAISTTLKILQQSSWPEIPDISRGIGRTMVTGAIVYDWCYDLLTPKEKDDYIAEFLRMAKLLECGYPPVKQSSVTSHSSEWMIMRDLLSAAIAIYDEFPEMYNLAAARFFREHLPVRKWFYQGHMHHQGSSYFKVRFASDLYALWIFDRMGAGNVYGNDQRFVPYNQIYRIRPDGSLLPHGDVNYRRNKPASMGLAALLAGSYYKDEYINNEFLKSPSIESRDKLFEFLWRDTQLGKRLPDDLPLTKYFGFPFGSMIARTGWDENSVIAEMKINVYNFVNHQHHDAGGFQIYYKGPLVIDSGIYKGTSGNNKGYNSPHNKNYFKRTIAHNSLLIYDPDETFKSWGYGGRFKTKFAVNDGGQRLPGDGWYPPKNLEDLLNKDYKTGEIIAYGFGPQNKEPDYTYLKGDITEAYSNKVKSVIRSFAFLNMKDEKTPAALIVFDKVVSSNPDFKKHWLLHSIEEPEIRGNQIVIERTKDGDSGKVINYTLLPEPENRELVTIGGPGKEFWVFGENYENNLINLKDDPANERGSWRVELSPKKSSHEDYFLNVMQVMDNHYESCSNVNLIKNDDLIGVQFADKIVTFNKSAEIFNSSFSLTISGDSLYKILLTDVAVGNWKVLKNNSEYISLVEVNSEEGTLYIEGDAGEYFLQKLDN